MAIRLASAIGQQREPIGILGGVDDAINKTGDAINSANAAKKAAERRESRERDMALDSALSSISTTIDAVPKDQETYRQTAAQGASELKNMWLNGAKKSEILLKTQELKNVLEPMKIKFEDDAKGTAKFFTDYKPEWNKEENRYTSDKYEFSDAESILTGVSRGQVPMSKDAPVRDMPVNKQDADVTEVVDIQNKGYFDLPIEERNRLYPNGAYTALTQATKDITGNFNDASLGYFGKDWSPKDQYSSLVTTENAGGLDTEKVVIDEVEIARDKAAFLSSAGTDLGDAKTKQYFRTLANKAGAAGKRAGLQGEELNTFVKENVLKAAAQDFDNRVLQDIEKTKIKTIDKDPDKEGKGLVINNGNGMFSNGNTSMNKTEEITPYIQRKYAAKEAQIKDSIEKLKKSTNLTDQQTAKNYEKSLTDLERLKASEAKDHIKYSNAKAKDDQYVSYGVVVGKDKNGNDIKENISFRPEDFFEKNGKWYMAGEEKIEKLNDEGDKVVIYSDRELPLDENNYKKLITEDKLVIPLLEQHSIKANEVKQSTTTKAAASKATDYEKTIKSKVKKPIAEYQVNKQGTKAKVKFSDGTEQVIDL
jgi:hypothetical protein